MVNSFQNQNQKINNWIKILIKYRNQKLNKINKFKL